MPLVAQFCWHRNAPGQAFAVALFRREFEITQVPERRRIAVSADNRYVLWLNGRRLGRGPLRGTLTDYQAEIYDLAPFLCPGRNVLAAEVRWMGDNTPVAEIHSAWPGWWVQELDRSDAVAPSDGELNTPGTWRVLPDDSVRPNNAPKFGNAEEFLGRLDRVDPARRPTQWREIATDSAAWLPAVACGPATNSPGWGIEPLRRLVPRSLPALEETDREFVAAWENRRPVSLPWTLPAGTGGELWLDAGVMTTSYPLLEFCGGAGREVHVTYAEALGHWQDTTAGRVWIKTGPRADLATGEPHGVRDELVLPGDTWTFEPFHWRTFRLVKIGIMPGPEAVTLATARHRFTAYPFSYDAEFSCAEPDIARWWEISLRTLRLCAHETYEDCPYFEQLNYVYDARLQALCNHYLANDTRLTERCLILFRDSFGPEGLTAGRAPSRPRQIIPPFSLHWVAMVHDYWQWTGAGGLPLVRSCLPVIDAVLGYFRRHLTAEHFVGALEPWAWVDWVSGHGWHQGVPPVARSPAGSTVLTGLFAHALDLGAELHAAADHPADAARWTALANRLRTAIHRHAWSESAGLFREGPACEQTSWSQHAQVMAVICGAADAAQCARLADRLITDPSLVPMSLAQRFLLARAMEHLDRFETLFPVVLAPWREMATNGLTTWQEQVDPSRSDCHAWSSWMVHDFFAAVLGIRPDQPGWTAIRIAPHFECTSSARGAVSTPAGRIAVDWQRDDAGTVQLRIETPPGVPVRVRLPDGNETHASAGGASAWRVVAPPPLSRSEQITHTNN